MKFFKKYFLIILNVISFCIALLDGFIWRNSDVGFPIFTIMGIFVSSLIGFIYLVYDMIKNKPKNIFARIALIWFSSPFLGVIGGFSGLIMGFKLVHIFL